MVPNEDKFALRQEARGLRAAISPQDRKVFEDDIAERLYKLPAVKNAKCIGVYRGIGSEASIDDLVRALRLLDPSPTVAYPVVHGNGLMTFCAVEHGEWAAFVEDPSVVIPMSEIPADHFVDPTAIDILLVPGVAFDENCHRLGQGGGYYDRFIPRLRPDCLTVGIAFDQQIFETVPAGVHDKRVDYVVTPTRIIQR